jgi:hypothetical protein
VHYVVAARLGTAGGTDVVADAGLTQGIQRIAFQRGLQTGHVTVVVSNDTAYIRADAFALVNYMGFNASAAARYAQRWVIIPHTDGDFSAVADDVTFGSFVDSLQMSGPLSAAPDTSVAGRRVLGVRGQATQSGKGSVAITLYARPAGSPLPVERVETVGSSRVTLVLSEWNETVRVNVPTGAVPIGMTGLQ